MTHVNSYRNRETGTLVSAIQYGEPHKWTTDASAFVAAFVLQMPINDRLTIANEHILDVVQPVNNRWQPNAGVADLAVVNPSDGVIHRLELGDWLVRFPDGSLGYVQADAFDQTYGRVKSEVDASNQELEELYQVVRGSFQVLEGSFYDHLARGVARSVLEAGWSKKESS